MNNIDIKDLKIDRNRLWHRLMAMAKIGATEKGGCNRQALTELDKQGRDLFVEWAKSAGCTVSWDAIGNVFVRRESAGGNEPPVLAGSHLDTQPTGGKFDGVYGVLAGLEVIECLNDFEVTTKHPIEIAIWTNEEGARFSPAMMGSGVFSGVFELEEILAVKDKSGITVKQALIDTGYSGAQMHSDKSIKAAFEVHIEQGPILEQEGKQIGVVSGIQGIRWYDLTIHGESVHAGPTPMQARRDPFKAVTAIIDYMYQMVDNNSPWARVTFGDVIALPGARNTVPETVKLAIDLRHPEQTVLDKMDQSFRKAVQAYCLEYGVLADITDQWNLPAVRFADACIATVRSATASLGYDHMSMVSGAGHDSGYISRVADTSMIFVPCENGISHNEAENASVEDLEAGCNVLLHSMLAMAEVVERKR